MVFRNSIHTFDQKKEKFDSLNCSWVARTIRNSSGAFALKCFGFMFKEQGGSSVIVVVLLLTKPTLSGLSVGTSHRPDCWTDTMTEVLSFSLSQFPGLTPRLDSLRFFGPRWWCKRDPLNKRLVWRRQGETADRHGKLWRLGKKNWAIWKKKKFKSC